MSEDRTETVGDFYRRLEAMPEWEHLREAGWFSFSRELLCRNYDALVITLKHLTGPEGLQYQDVANRWKLDLLLREISYKLHNFVASAKTLVDHSRRICKRLYEPKGALPGYEQEIQQRFVENPTVQFVHDLRVMCLHYRLPSVGVMTSWIRIIDEPGGPGELMISVKLDKSDLLTFDNWSSAAKKYLRAQPAHIDLSTVISDYFQQVIAFHSWMQRQQLDFHKKDIEAVSAAQREFFPRIAPQILALLEVRLGEFEKGSIGDIKSVLSVALGPNEKMELDLRFDSLAAWVDKAVELIGARINLPAALVDRIRRQSRRALSPEDM